MILLKVARDSRAFIFTSISPLARARLDASALLTSEEVGHHCAANDVVATTPFV